ncbi:MAG: TIGR03960 family B12-binding radical SAM protein [Chloroflexi bacterium]|nr:TIGR03960 family B12-binding radical SAM protein [Chloroflexota bacterium]MCL5076355.1 TIGR03960 family B12-binding radical SAM protein [Chloroflexota bacterium]
MNLDHILPRVTKPARYTGYEWNSVIKDWDRAAVRVVLIYPDIYEVGMSNLGLQILYDLVNKQDWALAERAYAPWIDMEGEMRASGLPLFSLESRRPLREFDVIGFSLSCELVYTNVLNLLNLAGVPLWTAERIDGDPLVIAGGSGTYNPEPLADFIDLFVIGDGEESLIELLQKYRDYGRWRTGVRAQGAYQRQAFCREAAKLPGIYVPALYQVTYDANGVVTEVVPQAKEASPRIRKRIVYPLSAAPTRPPVPYISVIHDRAMIEIQRGCTRGCRFCQAGMIYRPVRERPKEEILETVDALLANTGYEELGLVSLSSSDYSEIESLVKELSLRHPQVNISLPSLRIDSFSVGLASSIQRRKTGLTFAPEAGTQRLRDVINKGVSEDDLLRTVHVAYSQGWSRLKLYFMIGLPTETMVDVEGLIALIRQVLDCGRRERGGRAQLSVSIATFIPKPQTPFQWVGQEGEETLRAKQEYLWRKLRGVQLSWHDPQSSFMEAALSRGDRRLGRVVYRAWQLGCKFDAWNEQFHFDRWLEAFAAEGLDMAFYAHRQRPLDEVFPWDHIDSGVTKRFLLREYRRALRQEPTPDCRYGPCLGCGLSKKGALCNVSASPLAEATR